MMAGSVAFSVRVNGNVTITITLCSGRYFNNGSDTVNPPINSTAPSGNPSPGRFAWKRWLRVPLPSEAARAWIA